MKNNYISKDKRLLFSIAIILILLSCLFGCLIIKPKTISTSNYNIKNLKGIKLKENIEIKQFFKTDKNYKSIGFLASNEGFYIEKGTVYIYILNDKGNILKKDKISANEICNDNYYYKYYYFKYNFKKGKKYYIKITAKNLSDDIYIGKIDKSNEQLYINDEKINQSLALSFMYQQDYIYSYWYIAMIILFIILIDFTVIMKGKLQ